MFRKLFGKFGGLAGKEATRDGTSSTVDAVLLLGYRFTGHSRNAETIKAGEREFFAGIHRTLRDIGVIQQQVETQTSSSAFPVLSCDGYVTGNVLPIKISQKDVTERMNSVLPSHIQVYDFIETSPDFNVAEWDGAVCSCYVPTYLLQSTAKRHIGHRVSDTILTKLYDTSKHFMSLQDFSIFQGDSSPGHTDVAVTKYDILPSFNLNECEYLQLSLGFRGFTVKEMEKIVGVSLAVARNDMHFDELLEANSKIELPHFPRLMLDEVHFERYNSTLRDRNQYPPIDWSPIQASQNEFKRKIFLPSVVDKDMDGSLWWNEFIFRPKELKQIKEIITTDNICETNETMKLKKMEQDIGESPEIQSKNCGNIKDNKLESGKPSTSPKLEIETPSTNSRLVKDTKLDREMIDTYSELERDTKLKTELQNTNYEKRTYLEIEKQITDSEATLATEILSNLDSKTSDSHLVNSKKVVQKQGVVKHADTSDGNGAGLFTSSLCNSLAATHEEFKLFISSIFDDINLYLGYVKSEFDEGKKMQKEIGKLEVKVNLMNEYPELVDRFWQFEKTLDQVTMVNTQLERLCGVILPVFSEMELVEKMIQVIEKENVVQLKGGLNNQLKDLVKQLAKTSKDTVSLKSAQHKILNSIILLSRKTEKRKQILAREIKKSDKASKDSSSKAKVVGNYGNFVHEQMYDDKVQAQESRSVTKPDHDNPLGKSVELDSVKLGVNTFDENAKLEHLFTEICAPLDPVTKPKVKSKVKAGEPGNDKLPRLFSNTEETDVNGDSRMNSRNNSVIKTPKSKNNKSMDDKQVNGAMDKHQSTVTNIKHMKAIINKPDTEKPVKIKKPKLKTNSYDKRDLNPDPVGLHKAKDGKNAKKKVPNLEDLW